MYVCIFFALFDSPPFRCKLYMYRYRFVASGGRCVTE